MIRALSERTIEPEWSFAMQKTVSLADALRCEHAPLVFADRCGTLRDFTVPTLWTHVAEAQHCHRSGTMDWNEAVTVTNDASLLSYLQNEHGVIPTFPAAGDRPACFLDPREIRVGIVNAGGPAPGLCMVNDSITKRHFALAGDGHPVIYGYRGGFRGLAIAEGGTTTKWRLVPSTRLKSIDPAVETLVTDDHALDPVTFLGSSRFDLRKPENLQSLIRGVQQDKLDILYVVGGNGSQAAAQCVQCELMKRSYRGRLGHPLVVIGGPKTMDNDLLFADTTFGFQTTVDHTVEAIEVFHNTVQCLDRVGVMQVFGAASGFVALTASYCSGVVDYPVVPEMVERVGIWALARAFDFAADLIDNARFVGTEKALRAAGLTREEVQFAGILVLMQHLFEELAQRHDDKRHALVVVAEGVKGLFAHSGAGEDLMPFPRIVERVSRALNRREVKPHGDVQVTSLEPTYLIRDNAPRSYDVALCKFIGKAMADAALAGYTDCLVTRWCGRCVLVPLRLATALVNVIDPTDYFYRSMATRFKTPLDENYVAAHWPSLKTEFHRLYSERLGRQVEKLAQKVFARDDSTVQNPDLARIEAAMRLAESAHLGKSRRHEAPYISHPYRVAIAVLQQMIERRLDISSNAVAAALLHDTLEDAPELVREETIAEACGAGTLALVRALTGPSKVEAPDAVQRSVAKAARAQAGGLVAMRLKLLDRIDNLTDSLRVNKEAGGSAFRARYRCESIADFVPLASSLGDQQLTDRLIEAISFLEEST